MLTFDTVGDNTPRLEDVTLDADTIDRVEGARVDDSTRPKDTVLETELSKLLGFAVEEITVEGVAIEVFVPKRLGNTVIVGLLDPVV